MKKAMVVASMFIVTGCASISGERTQPVTVQTVHDNNEIAGIGCTLTNDAGSWFLTTPSSTAVHKSTGDLVIDCKKGNFAGSQILVSRSNGAVWGNVLVGGGIGYIIDRNTGAGFDYPATTTVQLRKIDGVAGVLSAPSPGVAGAALTATK